MHRRLYILVCFLLLWLSSTAGYRINVHSISRREGLSNGAVNTIAMDAEGYIWLGTWNGLNRYDGSNIKNYLPESNPFAIHNNVVRELYPTREGTIWMLTNKGIGLYDNMLNRFYSFFTQESEQINYENDISICQDNDEGILVSVFGSGIYKYNDHSGQFEKIEFSATSYVASLNTNRLLSIGGVVYCLTGNHILYKISGNELREVMRIPIDAAISSSSGILIQDRPYLIITQRGGSVVIADIHAKTASPFSIPDDIITAFAPSLNPGMLWAGTEKGEIYSMSVEGGNMQIKNILSDQFFKDPIGARVLCIYETVPDILWIGTDGNGAFNLKLSVFPNESLGSDQLSYPVVRCILITQNKDLLIGTKGGGIDVFDPHGHYVRNISVKDGLENNSVLSFLERADGTIWVGTDGRGVDIITRDLQHIKNYPRDFMSENHIDFASVYHILEGSDGRLYLGTSGFGVIMVQLDRNDQTTPVHCEQVMLDRNISTGGQQKQIVYALAEERPGIIWIGTRGNGVYQYNTITKRVLSAYSSNTHPDLIKNDDILAIAADSSNNIWVGSSAGIFAIMPGSSGHKIIAGINLYGDLSTTSIHAIELDKLGNLWVTTNQGLSFIEPKNQAIKNFNADDGLINIEYSDGASFFDHSSGLLYVGGTMGVDIIQTREIKFSSFYPPIAINELYIRNQAVEISDKSVLISRINLQRLLVLDNNQNAMAFFVSPLVYWGKERHKIAYRLKNFDDDWITSLQNQSISFINLNPGRYYLQLRVSDENGNWSDQVREVEIIVNPPFWKTTWAILVYIILIIGIQLMIIRSYRRRETRKKEAALIDYTLQKEKELQNYKIEFFTSLAHEFRAPLTLITSHIHALLEETKTAGTNPRLLKVYNNSIKLQKLVLEIMQFRKLEKGKEPLNITRANPEALAREVVADLQPLAQKYDITCKVFCNITDACVNTDADKYQRVLTNLVSNAIKYNKPGGHVNVRINVSEQEFSCEVEDNGIGISPELRNKVFEPFGISSFAKKDSFPGYRSTGLGLAVTKGIVELLKGSIEFESTPDKGTLFICRFPNHHLINAPGMVLEKSENTEILELVIETVPDEIITADESSPEKPNILLVDDDPDILSLLNEMLSPWYNLYFAKNGHEAIHMIERQRIELIVSDIMMPGMDGIELCCKIRENFDTSHLPLILLTAKAEIEDRIKGLQAGADSYIPKPFHPDHLKIRIEKLLTGRQNIKKKFGGNDEYASLIKELPDPFFREMLAYIDANIDDDTLLAEKLCDKLAISKSSLYNKTKSVLGTTPHGLINQRRVRKAAILLDTTSFTVSEIIDQTGFNSRAHFYELFNKAFGCSPTEYRQKRKSFT